MHNIKLLLITLIALIFVGHLNAQNKWGVGLTGGYDLPIENLSNWYSGTPLLGGKIIFSSSADTDFEIEYNYSNFSNSSITDRMFAYKSQIKYAYETKDLNGKPIFLLDNSGNYIPKNEVNENEHPKAKWSNADSLYSSNGSSNMTISSITINKVFYFERINALSSRFFITGGLGFHIYKHSVDSLLYGGLPFKNGKKVFLKPFDDSRVALGFNIGGGLESQIADNIAFDVRVKYSLIIGELRPMEAYTYKGSGFASEDKQIEPLEKVFPIQHVSFSASIKYYFQ